MIHPIIFENNTPVKAPNAIPQNNIETKDQNPMIYVSSVIIPPSKITQRITRKRATAVPSLKRLSPSNMSASLLGAHIDLNIARTATGSVAEISEPNNKHTINGTCNPRNGKRKKSPVAMSNAEISNQKIANPEIDFQLLSKCL